MEIDLVTIAQGISTLAEKYTRLQKQVLVTLYSKYKDQQRKYKGLQINGVKWRRYSAIT